MHAMKAYGGVNLEFQLLLTLEVSCLLHTVVALHATMSP
jgi:hypothetical protein